MKSHESVDYRILESASQFNEQPHNIFQLNSVSNDNIKSPVFLNEFHLNSLPESLRNLLTKKVVLEEISCYSGASLTVEGTYIPPEEKGKFVGVQPLQLILKANKKQNIDRAIQRIKAQIQQIMNLPKYKEKVLIGLEMAPSSFDVRGKVLGPGGANLQYITNETGAIVTLRGRGSGFIEPTTGVESIEPLHLCVEHNKYDVLQGGRQLAFNLIETVQQEWYNYQQHQSAVGSQQLSHSVPPQAVQVSSSAVSGSVNEGLQYSTAQVVSVPPPTAVSTSVPPPPLMTVPPPNHHVLPPPPTSQHHATLQLATNLNHLVQGPPPQIQQTLQQPPPTSVQTQQVLQQPQQQTMQQATIQQQQLLQQQVLPSAQPAVQQQAPVQSAAVAPQQSVVQPQQLTQSLLQPTLQQQPQPQQQPLLHQQAITQQTSQPPTSNPLQEIPTHVYTGGGGQVVAAPNILTQQVIPQASIITQQPQIIATQTSYPLQYMQGGQMVVYPGGGTMRSGENGTGGGVMLVQYQATGQGLRGSQAAAHIVRPIIQPQIVQLVNPQTGQVQHVIQHIQPTTHGSLLTGTTTGQVLLPQPQIIASPHQLQFTQIPQPQPIHILGSTPTPQPQSVIPASSSQNVVVSTSQPAVAPQLLAVRPLQAPQQQQGHKRRFEQDLLSFQNFSSPAVSASEAPSQPQAKKAVGEDNSCQRIPQEPPSVHSGTQTVLQDTNNKLSIPPQTDDLQDVQVPVQQRVSNDIKSDPGKRGRTGLENEVDSCTNREMKDKIVYSYSGGKPFSHLVTSQPQQVMCSLVQPTTSPQQPTQTMLQQYNTPPPHPHYTQHPPYYQQQPASYPPYSSWNLAPPSNQ